VAGHYECIGVPGGEEEVLAFLNSATEQGLARNSGGGREIVWRDPSGASVAVNTAPDGELVCARPSFFGSSRLPVLVNGIGEDPECRYCSRLFVDVLDEDGEMVYPLAVELEEIDAVMEAPPSDERRALRVTAFADSIETRSSDDAYNEAVSDDEAPVAAQSLVPVGFFTEPARRGLFGRVESIPEARALLTGIVGSVAERRNEATGHRFFWAEIDTFGGRYDVVIAAEEGEGLAAGAVVQLDSWLIGALEPS
jgi:hypothetical protein